MVCIEIIVKLQFVCEIWLSTKWISLIILNRSLTKILLDS